jgi:hypothetical protein
MLLEHILKIVKDNDRRRFQRRGTTYGLGVDSNGYVRLEANPAEDWEFVDEVRYGVGTIVVVRGLEGESSYVLATHLECRDAGRFVNRDRGSLWNLKLIKTPASEEAIRDYFRGKCDRIFKNYEEYKKSPYIRHD